MLLWVCVCYCSVIVPIVSQTAANRKVTPIEELVQSRGYPLEVYNVTTEDGYILTLHRMPHGKNIHVTNKIPVFLQHGIIGCSAAFIAPATGIAYHLADTGYDVWVGNCRGNLYSRRHESKNPDKDKTYWNFSFHEMGVYDLPAVLEFIKQKTGASKLNYIGFSMGATMFLVMGSEKPKYLESVDCVILMAPVARPKRLDMLDTKAKLNANSAVFNALHFLGINEIFKHIEFLSAIVHRIFSFGGWITRISESIMRITANKQNDIYDFKNSVDFYQYYPAGTNVMTYKHYIQIVRSGKFQQYDYLEKNKEHYNQMSSPPEYDLTKIKKRVYLLVGGADTIAVKEDVEWLRKSLPDAVMITDNLKHFTHTDFLYSLNMDKTLYKTVDMVFNDFKKTKNRKITKTRKIKSSLV